MLSREPAEPEARRLLLAATVVDVQRYFWFPKPAPGGPGGETVR